MCNVLHGRLGLEKTFRCLQAPNSIRIPNPNVFEFRYRPRQGKRILTCPFPSIVLPIFDCIIEPRVLTAQISINKTTVVGLSAQNPMFHPGSSFSHASCLNWSIFRGCCLTRLYYLQTLIQPIIRLIQLLLSVVQIQCVWMVYLITTFNLPRALDHRRRPLTRAWRDTTESCAPPASLAAAYN